MATLGTSCVKATEIHFGSIVKNFNIYMAFILPMVLQAAEDQLDELEGDIEEEGDVPSICKVEVINPSVTMQDCKAIEVKPKSE